MLVKLLGKPPIYARGKNHEEVCSRLFLATRALGFRKRSKHSFRQFIADQLKDSSREFRNSKVIKSDEKFIKALLRIGRLVIVEED